MRLKRYLSTALLLLLIIALTGCSESFNRTFNFKYDISGSVQSYDGQYLNEVILRASGGSTTMTASEGLPDEEKQNWRMDELSGDVTITPTKSGWSFIPESIDVEKATKNIRFTALPEGPGSLINDYIRAFEEMDAAQMADVFNQPQDSYFISDYQRAFDQLDEVNIEVLAIESFTGSTWSGSALVALTYDFHWKNGRQQALGWETEFTFKQSYGEWYIDTIYEDESVYIDELNLDVRDNASALLFPVYVSVPDRFVIETSYLDHSIDTVVSLYDGGMNLIDGNDDAEGTQYSQLTASLDQGLYYVEVSEYNNNPLYCQLKMTRVDE